MLASFKKRASLVANESFKLARRASIELSAVTGLGLTIGPGGGANADTDTPTTEGHSPVFDPLAALEGASEDASSLYQDEVEVMRAPVQDAKEEEIEILFTGSSLCVRFASLAGDFGCAFDGWLAGAEDTVMGGQEKMDQILIGDRLLRINGEEVLDTKFDAIVRKLREAADATRVLTFLRPALKYNLELDGAASSGIWLEPLNDLQEGAVFVGWADKKEMPRLHAQLYAGLALLALDGRAAGGWTLKKILAVVKDGGEEKHAFEFGLYVAGKIAKRQADVKDLVKNDALRYVTGQPFYERHALNFCNTLRNGDTEAALARIQGGQRLDVSDDLNAGTVHCAVQSRDGKLLDVVISEGGDVQAYDDNGMTPLHVAASLGEAELAAKLLQAGARHDALDKDGSTPLHLAAMHANASIIHLLLHFGKTGSVSSGKRSVPLLSGSLDGSSILAKRRASGAQKAAAPKSISEVHASQSLEYINAAETKWGWTALHFAARSGDGGIVGRLLKNGADPHAISNAGISPLGIARDAGNAEACGRLHEVIMQEPIHLVWPRGGKHIEAMDGPDVPWRYDRALRLKSNLAKKEESASAKRKEKAPFKWSVNINASEDDKSVASLATGISSSIGSSSTTTPINSPLAVPEFEPQEETLSEGEIWIGSRPAAEEETVMKRRIGVVVTIMDGSTLEYYPKLQWLESASPETHPGFVEHIHFNVGTASWSQFLKILPPLMKSMWQHYKANRRILIASSARTSHTLSRPSSAVLVFLMTKFRIELHEGQRLLTERCYFYQYRDAILKAGWLRKELKELTVSDSARAAIVRDSNTCASKDPASHTIEYKGWMPGIARTQPHPAFQHGLEDMQAKLHARRLKKYRESQRRFAREFYTNDFA